jgi:hypothetical protein
MNFLEKIDEIHRAERESFSIPENNTTYSSFIPVERVGFKSLCRFMIKKQEKAKLLLVDGKQRVYISDLNIIETILGMEKYDIKWFMQGFIALYMERSCKIQFEIDGEVFSGCGIENYPNKKELHLFSDSAIDINDFIFIVNLSSQKTSAGKR